MKTSVFGRRRFGVVLVVLTIVLVSCGQAKKAPRPMRLQVLAGTAQLIRGSSVSKVSDEFPVRTGDRIVQSRDGIAELTLESGRLFEIAGAELVVEDTTRLSLERGDLLAMLAGPATVDGAGLAVGADEGVFRIDRTLASRLGVYQGRANLRAGGETLSVPRFRQAIVAGSVVPKSPRPLRINPSDSWDRRFLQAALDLDVRLTNFGRGLEAQLGAGSGAGFFSRIMPGLADLTFLNPFLSHRRSDVLIGLALASRAQGQESVADRFGRALGLWSDGATWGLIAFEFGADNNSIFESLVEAVRLAGLRLGGPILGGGPRTGGPGSQPGSTPTSPSPSPGPSQPPPPPPDDHEEDDEDDTLDTIDGVIDDLRDKVGDTTGQTVLDPLS